MVFFLNFRLFLSRQLIKETKLCGLLYSVCVYGDGSTPLPLHPLALDYLVSGCYDNNLD